MDRQRFWYSWVFVAGSTRAHSPFITRCGISPAHGKPRRANLHRKDRRPPEHRQNGTAAVRNVADACAQESECKSCCSSSQAWAYCSGWRCSCTRCSDCSSTDKAGPTLSRNPLILLRFTNLKSLGAGPRFLPAAALPFFTERKHNSSHRRKSQKSLSGMSNLSCL